MYWPIKTPPTTEDFFSPFLELNESMQETHRQKKVFPTQYLNSYGSSQMPDNITLSLSISHICCLIYVCVCMTYIITYYIYI